MEVVSPVTLSLKGVEVPEEMSAPLEGAEVVASPVSVGNLATTVKVVPLESPVARNLKGEEMPTPQEGAEVVVSPETVRTLATALELAYLVPLMTKGEDMSKDVPTTIRRTGMVSPVRSLATALEVASLVSPSPMTLNLKGEEIPGHSTMEGAEKLASPVPTLATTLEFVSPMTLDLKGEEIPSHGTTLEGAEKVASQVPTHAPNLGVLSSMTLDLEEEMSSHVTMLARDESDADAAGCSNNEHPDNPTPTTNTGQDSQDAWTRPTKANAAEIPPSLEVSAAISTCPMLPPTPTSSSARHLPHPLIRPFDPCVPHVFPSILEQRGRG